MKNKSILLGLLVLYIIIQPIALGQGPEFRDNNNEYYTRKTHYIVDGVVLSSAILGATTANLLKGANVNLITNTAVSSLAALTGGSIGYFVFKNENVFIKKKYAKFMFPLIDTFIYGAIGFYLGAITGEIINPQRERDLPEGALIGAGIGTLIGAPTGGLLGYKLVINF